MDSTSSIPTSHPVNGSGFLTLLDTSDIILIGKVVSLQPLKADPSTVDSTASVEADLVLDMKVAGLEVLKGHSPTGEISVTTIEGILPGRPWSAFEKGKQYLLCLQEKNGKFILTDPGSPSINIPLLPYRFDREEPYLTRVADLLEQIILLSSDSASSQGMREIALTRASLGIPFEEGDQHLNRDQTTTQQAAIVLIMMSNGQKNGLEHYQEMLTSSASYRDVLDILTSAAQYIPLYNQPEYLPLLSELVENDQGAIGLAAIQTVRTMDGSDVESILIQALNQDEIEIRYQAVCGLSERNPGKIELPSFALFVSEENRFISFWKNWAISKQDE